jgi:class I fructose-bisphosphate aldolase
MATTAETRSVSDLLGAEADSLLHHRCETISAEQLHLPGPDFIERVTLDSDRNIATVRNLRSMYDHGRLAGTGYVSILPVDQGIEHSAGASFAPNPAYFDPANIVELAIEGGCNAVASTIGVLGVTARKYAHRIPYIVKLNHNELLTYPNHYDQITFGSPHQAFEMGAVGVGATIYFGSEQSDRQLQEVSEMFQEAHQLGMFTVAADLTSQANHLGVTIQADIIKQKQPENNNGYGAVSRASGAKYGQTNDLVYSELTTDNPIDLTRYQLAGCYMGRAGLINSGGASGGDSDLAQAVRTAVINKRAGGTGLITGRKAFQRPMQEGVGILHAVQDVYLSDEISIA